MSLIVAARFDTFEEAENAGRALLEEKFPSDSVSIFFVNPAGEHARYPMGGDRATDAAARQAPGGAVAGALSIGLLGLVFGAVAYFGFSAHPFVTIISTCVGAYLGSLVGALLATQREGPQPRRGVSTGLRHSGVLVAVHVQADNEALAAQTLKRLGGKDVEQTIGRWEAGKWVDFDPSQAPVLSDKVSLHR